MESIKQSEKQGLYQASESPSVTGLSLVFRVLTA